MEITNLFLVYFTLMMPAYPLQSLAVTIVMVDPLPVNLTLIAL